MSKAAVLQVIIDTQMKTNQVKSQVGDIQKWFNQLDTSKLGEGVGDKLKESLAKANKELGTTDEKLQQMANGDISKLNLNAFTKSSKNAQTEVEKIYKIISKLDDKTLQDAFKIDPSTTAAIRKQITETKNALKEIGSNPNTTSPIEGALGGIGNLPKVKKEVQEIIALIKSGDFEKAKELFTGSTSDSLSSNTTKYTEAIGRLQKAKQARDSGETTGEVDGVGKTKIKPEDYDAYIEKYIKVRDARAQLQEILSKALNTEGTSDLIEKLKGLNQEEDQAVQKAKAFGAAAGPELAEKAQQGTQAVGKGTEAVGDLSNKFMSASKDASSLVSHFASFTSLTGIFNILKNAVRSAFESVKELDSAMNSIAVVTNMTTDDLWKQIDAYTELASATGSTISGTYEVAQLYYQQGLKTNDVLKMTEETLKFARIAGVDYANATDYMTAALRGFNLEADNVQHVNDVYSNLAANTASSQKEIAVAMTKVASLANSANMSLENTAGFLAQIIQTTRESAETAGTALKTVVARFAEVKSLVSEGQLEGTDEEGNAISINKIDTALRTAGLSLTEFVKGNKGLDEIFIELAKKWDTLSTSQQRYIATQAAGSRQQSRFLALMQDYDGLMTTLGYATDSAGASQEQFDKTLESLESKLNNLKNAWTEFTTGIANSKFIKTAVDLVTNLLNKINDATDGFGDFGKSISRIGLLIGSLKIGGNILQGLGQKLGTSLMSGMAQNIQKSGTQITGEIGNLINGVANAGGKGGSIFESLFGKDSFGGKIVGNIEDKYKNLLQFKINERKANLIQTLQNPEDYDDVIQPINDSLDELDNSFNQAANTSVNFKDKIKLFTQALFQSGDATESLTLKERIKQALDKVGIQIGKAKLIEMGKTLLLYAAIAAAIIGIIAVAKVLINYAKDRSLNGQMENLNAINTVVKQSAEDCKDAYEDLLSQEDSTNSLIDELNDLVKGTDEWKNKLMEINSQVLELIDTYPTLAKYMSVDSNGMLTISEEGWDAAVEEQQQQALNSQAALGIGNVNKQNVQKKINSENLAETLGLTIELDGTSKEELSSLAEQYAKEFQEGTISNVSYQVLEMRSGLSEEGVKGALASYVESIQEADAAIKSFAESAVLSSEELQDSDYSSEIADIMSSQLSDYDYEEENLSSTWLNKEWITNEMAERGLTHSASRKTNLKRLYSDMSGVDLSDLEDWDMDRLQRAIDQIYQADKIQDATDAFAERINNADEEIADAITHLFSDSGSGLTQEDLNDYRNDNGEIDQQQVNEQLKQQAIGAGYYTTDSNGNKTANLEEYAQAMNYTSAEAMQQNAYNIVTAQAQMLADTLGKINNYTQNSLDETTEGLSTDALQSMRDAFYNVRIGGGKVSGEGGLAGIYDEILGQVKDEQDKEAVADILNSTDWLDISEIKSTVNSLDDFGIEVTGLSDRIISATGALEDVDLTEFKEEISSAKDLIDEFKGRDADDNEVDSDTYLKILALNPQLSDQFYFDGESYYYLGDSMSTLTEAIYEAIGAIKEEKTEGIEERVHQGEAIQSAIDNSTIGLGDIVKAISTEDYQDNGVWTEEKLTSYKNAIGYENAEWDNLSVEEMYEALQTYINDSYGANGEVLESNLNNLYSPLYGLYANGGTAQGILSASTDIGNEEENAAAVAQQEKSLQALISGSSEASAMYDELDGKVVGHDNLLKAMAYDYTQLATKIDKINSAFEDNKDVLTTAKKGTTAYNTALKKIADSINDAYGTDVSADWVENNLKLIDKMNDSDADYLNFLSAMAKETGHLSSAFGTTDAEISAGIAGVRKEVDALNDQPISVSGGIQALDNSSLIKSLWDASTSLEQFQQLCEESGVHAEVEWSDYSLMGTDKWKRGISSITYKKTSGQGTGSSSSSSSGGGGSDSSNDTKASQDPFYNYITTADRAKEALEDLQDQQDLLFDSASIKDSYDQQEEAIAKVIGANKSYLNEVNTQLGKMQQDGMSKYSKYISFAEDGSLRLSEDYFKLTGDAAEEIDEWIEAYDDLLGRQDDLNDELTEYKKQLKELWEGWRDDYIDLTNEIADILKEHDEKALEDEQDYYDKLEEESDNYLEAVKDNIQAERDARDKANSYKELSQKQAQLALLQRDTSGRYASEAMSLQDEIDEAEQDLADETVDDILEQLEKDADDAKERHQDILDAMQEQIDYNEENRVYIQEAEDIIAQGDEAIENVIKTGDDYLLASDAERNKQLEELESTMAGAETYVTEGFTNAQSYIEKVINSATAEENEKVTWAVGQITEAIKNNSSSGSGTDGGVTTPTTEDSLKGTRDKYSNILGTTSKLDNGSYQAKVTATNNQTGQTQTIYNHTFQNRQAAINGMNDARAKAKAMKYLNGGMVDYTGPAWVDGTPSKPEAFLNADQTEIIKQFALNLSRISSLSGNSDNIAAGDCTINIDIGNLGTDYDIDQAIQKVKNEIVSSTTFRNVNTTTRRR